MAQGSVEVGHRNTPGAPPTTEPKRVLHLKVRGNEAPHTIRRLLPRADGDMGSLHARNTWTPPHRR